MKFPKITFFKTEDIVFFFANGHTHIYIYFYGVESENYSRIVSLTLNLLLLVKNGIIAKYFVKFCSQSMIYGI